MNCQKKNIRPAYISGQRKMLLSCKGKVSGRSQFDCWIVLLSLAAWLVGGSSVLASEQGTIHQDVERKLVTLADGQGQLTLRLSYDGRCVLDQVIVRGREVAAETGVFSGVRMDGQWFTTRSGIATPNIARHRDTLIVSG